MEQTLLYTDDGFTLDELIDSLTKLRKQIDGSTPVYLGNSGTEYKAILQGVEPDENKIILTTNDLD